MSISMVVQNPLFSSQQMATESAEEEKCGGRKKKEKKKVGKPIGDPVGGRDAPIKDYMTLDMFSTASVASKAGRDVGSYM